LVFNSGFILCLEKAFCVPSFNKNLISILQFAHLGVSFNFMKYGFTLLNKSKVVGFVNYTMVFTPLNYKLHYL